MDSSGIRSLMDCHNRLQAADRPSLTLVVEDGPVLRVLRLTQMNNFFSIVSEL